LAKKKDARERILKAAFEAFTASTYDKVSIDEITKKAKVSKGGLFHHFDSKYALARDALFWFVEREMEEFFAEEIKDDMDPQEQLMGFIDFGIGIMVEDIKLARLVLDLYEEALSQERDLEIWLDFFLQYVGYLEDIFKLLKVKNPRMKALLLMSNMDGLAMYYLFLDQSEESLDIKVLRQELYQMYIPDYKKIKRRRASGKGK